MSVSPPGPNNAKIRSPIAVAILSVVTLGIYVIVWWYFINREMADYGLAHNTNELGDNPAMSTLALFPGSLLVLPGLWTTVTTFQRIQTAQNLTRKAPINGWLGLALTSCSSLRSSGTCKAGSIRLGSRL
jgi:uncharacterized protein DUF4234